VTNVFIVDKNNIVTSITALSAIGSIGFASVAALFQKRIKRLIAYSTIAHTGFLIISVSCLSFDSIKAAIIYIVLYVIMTLMLFSLLLSVATTNDQQKYLIN
jgi:NADH-quinone oxidoreductase subunit N